MPATFEMRFTRGQLPAGGGYPGLRPGKRIDEALAMICEYDVPVPQDEMDAGIRVTTKDGRSFEKIEYGHLGGLSQPLGRKRILEKFMDCTQAFGDSAAAERMAVAVIGLDAAPTLAELTTCSDGLARARMANRNALKE
jgi:hypothetical protein